MPPQPANIRGETLDVSERYAALILYRLNKPLSQTRRSSAATATSANQ